MDDLDDLDDFDDVDPLPGGNGILVWLPRFVYGLTLAQVGERVGRSPSWVWKVEQGHLRIGFLDAVHVAAEVAQMGKAGEGKKGPYDFDRKER